MAAVLWLIEVFSLVTVESLYRFGILPRTAIGLRGRPGMRRMSPVSTTRNPAPASIWIPRTVTTKSAGRPRSFGSSDNEAGVLAIQIGNLLKIVPAHGMIG